MFVFGNLVQAIAVVLDVVLQALLLVILINALLSWVRPDPSNPIVQFLDRVSDLVCNPIRRVIPTNVSGIDFAPFVAMLVIWFVKMFLVSTLNDVAVRMG
ncbi:MAG TPA: YggT family protein [Candidatus Eisenbacteria bacterium]|nr:YggT family protein [Candidatus Eisenbacteria bacterium]